MNEYNAYEAYQNYEITVKNDARYTAYYAQLFKIQNRVDRKWRFWDNLLYFTQLGTNGCHLVHEWSRNVLQPKPFLLVETKTYIWGLLHTGIVLLTIVHKHLTRVKMTVVRTFAKIIT